MREGIDTDKQASDGSVDGLAPYEFLEAQYRKTELRNRYRDAKAADRVGKLLRAIEQDVIPRLVSDRRESAEQHRSADHVREISAVEVARFVQILIGRETSVEPSSFVGDIRADGVSVEHVYLHLLAPAARSVGTLWDDDLCTFIDVTAALGTLHRIMLVLSADFRFEPRKLDPARRMLLVQQSGGTHTFGLQMVAEFLRRAAWSVDMPSLPTNDALCHAVHANWFTVVGFSVAFDLRLDLLAEAITIVRRSSLNPAVGILVGGPAFEGRPDFVEQVGADGMAADAVQAVLEAERFVIHV